VHNSCLFVFPDSAESVDRATIAAITVPSLDRLRVLHCMSDAFMQPNLKRCAFIYDQVVDGTITSAEAASSKFEARRMNQRTPVVVAETAPFRNALSLRGLEGCTSEVKVCDVQTAAECEDSLVFNLRMIVLLSAGTQAMTQVSSLNAGQLQMWLLQHICCSFAMQFRVVARMLVYLCVCDDGLAFPLLLDMVVLDCVIDAQSRNSSVGPERISLCRSVLPCLLFACSRARIVYALQLRGMENGVVWKVASSALLLPLLEVAAGLTSESARFNLLDYFQGGLRHLMTRLNHCFHDHSGAASSNRITAGSSDEVESAFAPSNASFLPPASSPQPFNVYRMILGTRLSLSLGDFTLSPQNTSTMTRCIACTSKR
jgi:hypothetical protein